MDLHSPADATELRSDVPKLSLHVPSPRTPFAAIRDLASSGAWNDDFYYLSELLREREGCAKDRACEARVNEGVRARLASLWNAFRRAKALEVGDQVAFAWVDAERASLGDEHLDGTGESSLLGRFARNLPADTRAGALARYDLASRTSDAKLRRQLYAEILASSDASGWHLLVRLDLGLMEESHVAAAEHFRAAAERARSNRNTYDLILIGTLWANRAVGHDAAGALEAAMIATEGLRRRPDEVGASETIARVLAWGLAEQKPAYRELWMPQTLFRQTVHALAVAAHERGDLDLESALMGVKPYEKGLIPARRWDEGGTRAAIERLHRACLGAATKGSAPTPLRFELHLTHALDRTTVVPATVAQPDLPRTYVECMERRGSRFLWNAPDFEADLRLSPESPAR